MSGRIQKVTVKALFYQDGKFLFVRDQAGRWELPGGKLDFGEHPKETLKREIAEELFGYSPKPPEAAEKFNTDSSQLDAWNDIQVGGVVHVWDFITEFEGKECQFIVIVYKAEADLSNIKLSGEHSEFVWIAIDEINNYPMREGYKESVKDA